MNANRIKLLAIIIRLREACADDLLAFFSMRKEAICSHLVYLMRYKLLYVNRKVGQVVFYSASKPGMELINALSEAKAVIDDVYKEQQNVKCG